MKRIGYVIPNLIGTLSIPSSIIVLVPRSQVELMMQLTQYLSSMRDHDRDIEVAMDNTLASLLCVNLLRMIYNKWNISILPYIFQESKPTQIKWQKVVRSFHSKSSQMRVQSTLFLSFFYLTFLLDILGVDVNATTFIYKRVYLNLIFKSHCYLIKYLCQILSMLLQEMVLLVNKSLYPPELFINLAMFGNGYESFGQSLLDDVQSMHIIHFPEFFLTGTTLETHSIYLALEINLASNLY